MDGEAEEGGEGAQGRAEKVVESCPCCQPIEQRKSLIILKKITAT